MPYTRIQSQTPQQPRQQIGAFGIGGGGGTGANAQWWSGTSQSLGRLSQTLQQNFASDAANRNKSFQKFREYGKNLYETDPEQYEKVYKGLQTKNKKSLGVIRKLIMGGKMEPWQSQAFRIGSLDARAFRLAGSYKEDLNEAMGSGLSFEEIREISREKLADNDEYKVIRGSSYALNTLNTLLNESESHIEEILTKKSIDDYTERGKHAWSQVGVDLFDQYISTQGDAHREPDAKYLLSQWLQDPAGYFQGNEEFFLEHGVIPHLISTVASSRDYGGADKAKSIFEDLLALKLDNGVIFGTGKITDTLRQDAYTAFDKAEVAAQERSTRGLSILAMRTYGTTGASKGQLFELLGVLEDDPNFNIDWDVGAAWIRDNFKDYKSDNISVVEEDLWLHYEDIFIRSEEGSPLSGEDFKILREAHQAGVITNGQWDAITTTDVTNKSFNDFITDRRNKEQIDSLYNYFEQQPQGFVPATIAKTAGPYFDFGETLHEVFGKGKNNEITLNQMRKVQGLATIYVNKKIEKWLLEEQELYIGNLEAGDTSGSWKEHEDKVRDKIINELWDDVNAIGDREMLNALGVLQRQLVIPSKYEIKDGKQTETLVFSTQQKQFLGFIIDRNIAYKKTEFFEKLSDSQKTALKLAIEQLGN